MLRVSLASRNRRHHRCIGRFSSVLEMPVILKNPSSNEMFGSISATEMARDELLVDVFLDKELFQYFLGFIVNVFHVGT